jgi:hypothetical protein
VLRQRAQVVRQTHAIELFGGSHLNRRTQVRCC